MKNTDNFKFLKPELSDLYSINHQNDNWEKADEVLKELGNKIMSLENENTSLESQVKNLAAVNMQLKDKIYPNGKAWLLGAVLGGNIKSLQYANGILVASCTDAGLYFSADGIVWSQSNIVSGTYSKVYYGDGIWIACGAGVSAHYSTDGITWTSCGVSFEAACYGNGMWAAGNGEDVSASVYYSTDGKTWTQCGAFYIEYIHYGNGIFVAACPSGLRYSTDGKTWTISNITSGTHNKILCADGMWVAGGSNVGSFLYSTDGKVWTTINNGYVSCLFYANGIWLAQLNGATSGFRYSTDGKVWTPTSIGNINNVAFANGMYLASGSVNSYYSTDGKTWTVCVGLGKHKGFRYANGIWVACCNSSSNDDGLYYSTDGIEWIKSNIISGAAAVLYANEIWVARFSDTIYYSQSIE